jgi:biopolymer transport protein ExbD
MNQSFSFTFLIVAVILLLSFMVATCFRCHGIPIQIPIASQPQQFREQEDQTVVHLKVDRTVYIQQHWVPRAQFLNAARRIPVYNRILLYADARLKYEDVIPILRSLGQANRNSFMLMAERIKPEGSFELLGLWQ